MSYYWRAGPEGPPCRSARRVPAPGRAVVRRSWRSVACRGADAARVSARSPADSVCDQRAGITDYRFRVPITVFALTIISVRHILVSTVISTQHMATAEERSAHKAQRRSRHVDTRTWHGRTAGEAGTTAVETTHERTLIPPSPRVMSIDALGYLYHLGSGASVPAHDSKRSMPIDLHYGARRPARLPSPPARLPN